MQRLDHWRTSDSVLLAVLWLLAKMRITPLRIVLLSRRRSLLQSRLTTITNHHKREDPRRTASRLSSGRDVCYGRSPLGQDVGPHRLDDGLRRDSHVRHLAGAGGRRPEDGRPCQGGYQAGTENYGGWRWLQHSAIAKAKVSRKRFVCPLSMAESAPHITGWERLRQAIRVA